MLFIHLDFTTDCGVFAGLGPGGETKVSAGAPPAPLGVKCPVSPHLDLA